MNGAQRKYILANNLHQIIYRSMHTIPALVTVIYNRHSHLKPSTMKETLSQGKWRENWIPYVRSHGDPQWDFHQPQLHYATVKEDPAKYLKSLFTRSRQLHWVREYRHPIYQGLMPYYKLYKQACEILWVMMSSTACLWDGTLSCYSSLLLPQTRGKWAGLL